MKDEKFELQKQKLKNYEFKKLKITKIDEVQEHNDSKSVGLSDLMLLLLKNLTELRNSFLDYAPNC